MRVGLTFVAAVCVITAALSGVGVDAGECKCDDSHHGYVYIWTNSGNVGDGPVKIGCASDYEDTRGFTTSSAARIYNEIGDHQATTTAAKERVGVRLDAQRKVKDPNAKAIVWVNCPAKLNCNKVEQAAHQLATAAGQSSYSTLHPHDWSKKNRPLLAGKSGYTEWFPISLDKAVEIVGHVGGACGDPHFHLEQT
eukprot:TRINITY_DN85790_c0_g1_i1.p2 TRINITY_DN85790_c0_g1~~TRINITY_DN85790_c0_g1_i1.p2  ORF type:complete len:195 (+),score=45.19 TRINITY_DN85790_c0_g1_i1:25-609(+)